MDMKDFMIVTDGFNRTFMELKFVVAVRKRVGLLGFNRTFMELKFHRQFGSGVQQRF